MRKIKIKVKWLVAAAVIAGIVAYMYWGEYCPRAEAVNYISYTQLVLYGAGFRLEEYRAAGNAEAKLAIIESLRRLQNDYAEIAYPERQAVFGLRQGMLGLLEIEIWMLEGDREGTLTEKDIERLAIELERREAGLQEDLDRYMDYAHWRRVRR